METSADDNDSINRKPEVLGIALTSIAIVVLSIAARIYVRTVVRPYFGVDDVFMIISGVFVVAAAVFASYTVTEGNYGTGQHLYEVNALELRNFYISIYVWEVGYCFTLVWIKLAILCYYNRLQRSRLYIWTIVFVVIGSIAIIVAQIVQCWPINDAWDASEGPHGPDSETCVNDVALSFFAASYNIVTDFWIWGICIKMLRNLQVAPRQKVEVIIIFSIGLFACGASIVRICTINQFYNEPDQPWNSVPIIRWSFLELTLAILAANLPTLKPGWNQLTVWIKEQKAWISTRDFVNRLPILSGRRDSNTSSDGAQTMSVTGKRNTQTERDTGSPKLKKAFQRSAVDTEKSSNNGMLAEIGRWGLNNNDFCQDLEMQHVLPSTQTSANGRKGSDQSIRKYYHSL